jgi:hypothetical protein
VDIWYFHYVLSLTPSSGLHVPAVIHELFRHIFTGLEERYAEELAVIRAQYPSEPVQFTDRPLVIHWAEGMQMLRDAGHEVSDALCCLRV